MVLFPLKTPARKSGIRLAERAVAPPCLSAISLQRPYSSIRKMVGCWLPEESQSAPVSPLFWHFIGSQHAAELELLQAPTRTASCNLNF